MERDHLEEFGVDGITILEWTRDIEWEKITWVYLGWYRDYWLVLVSVI
jgi:hypothetical protein